jgi:hypothetical protein
MSARLTSNELLLASKIHFVVLRLVRTRRQKNESAFAVEIMSKRGKGMSIPRIGGQAPVRGLRPPAS